MYEGLWFCLQTAVVVTSDQHQSGCHWATSLCSESFLHPCSTPTLPAKAPAVIAVRRVHQHCTVQNCGYSLYPFQFFFSFSSHPSDRLHYGHVVASSLMWIKETSINHFISGWQEWSSYIPVLVFSPVTDSKWSKSAVGDVGGLAKSVVGDVDGWCKLHVHVEGVVGWGGFDWVFYRKEIT